MPVNPSAPILPKKVATKNTSVSSKLYSPNPQSQISDRATDSLINQSINTLRQTDPIKVIRSLTRGNGSFSKNVWSYVQIAMSGYTVSCRNSVDHRFNPEATTAAKTLVASLDSLYNYTAGFGDKQSMDGLLETLLKEVIQAGGCCAELVLNKDYLPEQAIALPITDLSWFPKKNGMGKYPKQQNKSGSGDAYIELDIPTFFYADTHKDTTSNTNLSPLEPALQMLFIFYEFIEDVAKTIRASGHTRMVLTLVKDQIIPNIDSTIRSDPAKLRVELERIRTSVEDIVSNLSPQEALVVFDNVTVDTLKASGDKADYTAIMETFGSLLASSLKSMPSILGLAGSGGSQNLATTEAMVFIKLCSAMQTPVETVMSRLLTLAVRLTTETDVYCEFKFNPIDLRPATELAAHRTTMLNDDKWFLSAGYLSDEEFAHRWGLTPIVGHTPLAGTMFLDSGSNIHPRDLQQNIQGGVRALNEGTKQGTPTSSPANGTQKK